MPGAEYAHAAFATRIAAEEPDGGRIGLLTTVINWRDAGAARGVPEATAAELAGLGPDDFADALAWVLGPVPAGPPLVTRDDDGRLSAHPLLSTTVPVPDAMWVAVVRDEHRSEALMAILRTARAERRLELALGVVTPRAEAGDPAAMTVLGWVATSTGDAAAAEDWLRRAALAGHPQAMDLLGNLLWPDRREEGRGWLERAAAAGDPDAMNSLGVLLAREDPPAARTWWERAAALDHLPAVTNLGELAADGGDLAAATAHWTAAADRGHVPAMLRLAGHLDEDDPDVERLLSAAADSNEIEACQRYAAWLSTRDPERARALWRRVAEAGSAPAMSALATLLSDTDPPAARTWFERAAEAGDPDAMVRLAESLRPVDETAALAWYVRAAEAGDVDAMRMAGVLGDGDRWLVAAAGMGDARAMAILAALRHEADPVDAAGWAERAAEAGGAEAMDHVGRLLEEVDVAAGRVWTQRAAYGGSTAAMVRLGRAAHDDPATAKAWFERAAEAGDLDAMHLLALLLDEADQAYEVRTFAGIDLMHTPRFAPLRRLFDPDDPQAAQRWCRRAAEAGHTGAMNSLGVLLEAGDPIEAQRWFRQAAEAGDAPAMDNLARSLRDEDPAEARRWYELAAAAGHEPAVAGAAKARRRHRWLTAGSVALMLGCVTASAVGFHLAGANYLAWYLANGPLVALITGLVSLTIDLDRIPTLISPSPRRYVRACRLVLTLPRLAWAPAFLPSSARVLLPGDPGFLAALPPGVTARTVITAADGTVIRTQTREARHYQLVAEGALPAGWWSGPLRAPLATLVVGLVIAAFAVWFVVIAPLQYVTSALVGGPVRRMRERGVTVLYSASGHQSVRMRRADEPVPATSSEVQFYRRPVTTTLAISSLVLWLLSLLR